MGCGGAAPEVEQLPSAAVPKFVMLSTLGPDGSARLREDPGRIQEVTAEVEAMGVKVLEQFALLGQWDFLNIIDAPDVTTMAKVATSLAARGTLKTMTLPIVEIDALVAALSDE
jgi:uncharacterized protein with GYD domain